MLNPMMGAKQKFMGEQEGGPVDAPEDDAEAQAGDLSPQAAKLVSDALDAGVMPSPQDLAAAGLDPQEADLVMKIVEAIVAGGEDEFSPGDAAEDAAEGEVEAPVPPKKAPFA